MIVLNDRKNEKLPLGDKHFVRSKTTNKKSEITVCIQNREEAKQNLCFYEEEIKSLMEIYQAIRQNLKRLKKNRDKMKFVYSSYLSICSEADKKIILTTEGIEDKIKKCEFDTPNWIDYHEEFLKIPLVFASVLERDITHYSIYHKSSLPADFLNSKEDIDAAIERALLANARAAALLNVDALMSDCDEGYFDDIVEDSFNKTVNDAQMRSDVIPENH